jgi:HEPN domain-containing protein
MGQSLNEASNIELAKAFLKEAKCDLETADILIATMKPRLEESMKHNKVDDEVFCVGRRTLFMLQQATEKLAKAFILAYPKPLLENMRKIVKRCSGVDLPVLKFSKELLEESDELEPESMGHKPHEAIVKLLRKYLDNLTTYREPIIDSYEQLSKVFEKFFNTLSDTFPEEKDRIEELKKVFLNELYRPLAKQLEVLYNEYLSAEKVGWRGKNEPPCLDTLEEFRKFRSEVERVSRESLEKFLEARKKLTPYQDLLSSLIGKAELKNEDKELIEYFLRVLYGEEGEKTLSGFFAPSVYLSAFIVEFLPCLAFYVSGGRYPRFKRRNGKKMLVNEIDNEIWNDIMRIKELKEELDFLLRETEKAMKGSPALTTLPRIQFTESRANEKKHN